MTVETWNAIVLLIAVLFFVVGIAYVIWWKKY